MNPYTVDNTPGVAGFALTYSATITAPGYTLLNSYISARTTPGVGNYGTTSTNGGALAPGNTNELTFSGFTGIATLTETASANLVQNTGFAFASGGTLNWAPGTNIPAGDRPAADTDWYVTIPTLAAQTITYAANFGQSNTGIFTPAYNESTGFAFNIIPEPSSAMLLGAGVLGLVIRRRRSR